MGFIFSKLECREHRHDKYVVYSVRLLYWIFFSLIYFFIVLLNLERGNVDAYAAQHFKVAGLSANKLQKNS